jgi:hypothetical protein
MQEISTTSPGPFSVRRFQTLDRDAVLALWSADVVHSLRACETHDVLNPRIEGGLDGNHHVWVAETVGQIIGSVSVIRDSASLAHLRYMCVPADLPARQAVIRGLADAAIRDAYERGYLKLVVHTQWPPARLADGFHQLGFEFSRERLNEGEHVLEFYQNLYQPPRPPAPQQGQAM